MKSLLLLTGFLAIILVIYGVLLFRARYRKLKRIAESNQVEVLAAALIAERKKQESSAFAEASSDRGASSQESGENQS